MEEGGEEVFGLTQRLALYRAQTFHALNEGCELLLDWERGHEDRHFPKPAERDFQEGRAFDLL
jgi:hypothetical protein